MPGFRVARRGRFLIADLGVPHRLVSWAIVRGGQVEGRTVAWCHVDDRELAPPVDARTFLEARLAEAGLEEAVGLMTGASLDAYVDVTRARGEAFVRCLATVGLENALRAGDEPGAGAHPGTINLLCQLSSLASDEALLEALALAAEARALTVLEAGIRSRQSGRAASGTGTDCIVIAAPIGGPAAGYAGKHTVLGHLVGAAVAEAVDRGVRSWLARHGAHPRAAAVVP
ncbi:MAG: adenosylcobinamide amidohydrolase [Thermodesulfobacteriota bacterium]